MTRALALLACACAVALACTTPAPAPVKAAPAAWLSLEDLQVRDGAPTGLFVRGTRGPDGSFVPGAVVEGTAPTTADAGHPGYLELSLLRFMGAEEARKPVPPYVEGRMTDAGFVPSSRTVHD